MRECVCELHSGIVCLAAVTLQLCCSQCNLFTPLPVKCEAFGVCLFFTKAGQVPLLHVRIMIVLVYMTIIYFNLHLNILFPISCPLSFHRFIMKLFLLTVSVLLLVVAESTAERILSRRTKRELASPLHVGGIRDPFGSYCQRRGGCCPGRDDLCTVPYLDTICYCDLFCNRTVSDCCPDFWGHCLGVEPPFIGE